MIVIIAGSRTIKDYQLLCDAIKESQFHITEIVSGGAYGVDKLGEQYAIENNIDLVIMKANWGKYGKSAGYIRNRKMAEYVAKQATLLSERGLIAIRENNSAGTGHMIDLANMYNIRSFVKNV